MEAVEILLASKIQCQLPYPWVMLETDYYNLNPQEAWFSEISGQCTVMPYLRNVRPRSGNTMIQEMLKRRDEARLFVEPLWAMPVNVHYRFSMYPFLLQECIRLRAKHPKGYLVEERTGLELREAVRRALDNRWRRTEGVEMPKPPASLPYYAELLQRLSGNLRSWESLLTNLYALAARRAYLFDRHVESTDWRVVARVMKDSVPSWVYEILIHFAAKGRFKSLQGKYIYSMLSAEMKRLLEQGIVYNHKGEWLIQDPNTIGADILQLLNGQLLA